MLGNKADKAILKKYPNAEIFKFHREKKLSKGEFAADVAVDAFTDFVDPIATFDLIKNIKKQFYLVHDEGKFYMVMVEKDTISSEEIDGSIIDNRFEHNGYIYINKGQLKQIIDRILPLSGVHKSDSAVCLRQTLAQEAENESEKNRKIYCR